VEVPALRIDQCAVIVGGHLGARLVRAQNARVVVTHHVSQRAYLGFEPAHLPRLDRTHQMPAQPQIAIDGIFVDQPQHERARLERQREQRARALAASRMILMISISSGSIASTPPFERDHHVLDDAVDLRGRRWRATRCGVRA